MISRWIESYTGWWLGQPPPTNKLGSWNHGQIGWNILKIWNHQVAEYQIWCAENQFTSYWTYCRVRQGTVVLISKCDFARTGVVSIQAQIDTNCWDHIRWEDGTYDCKTCIHKKSKSENAGRRDCWFMLVSPWGNPTITNLFVPICLLSTYSNLIHWLGLPWSAEPVQCGTPPNTLSFKSWTRWTFSDTWPK